jgi:hypothetical protein
MDFNLLSQSRCFNLDHPLLSLPNQDPSYSTRRAGKCQRLDVQLRKGVAAKIDVKSSVYNDCFIRNLREERPCMIEGHRKKT